MQRVAIARALANRPALLLADEPTGELDEDTGEQIADLFDRVHADGTAIVVVTHNPLLARRAQRHLAMKRGALGTARCRDMMLRVAWRSLMTRPIRAAVLAAGFGFGIAVMAALLGVGQVILEQAHAPALNGGGDLVVSGPFGSVPSARFVISSVQHAPELAPRGMSAIVRPRRARLFLMTPGKAIR